MRFFLLVDRPLTRKKEIRGQDVKEKVEKIKERTRILERKYLNLMRQAGPSQSHRDNENHCEED